MTATVTLCKKVIEGARRGPNLLVLGGVHGDEFESMAAIRRLLDHLDPADLRGRLTAVPVVNEAAYWRGRRCAGDGLDLARTCPGRAGGTITERTAHAVSREILLSDYLVDLHSGGIAMEFYPTAGYMLHPDEAVLEVQRRMALALNLPVVWGTSAGLDGRSLSVARDAGVPAVYTEWMGGGTCDPRGVEAYFEGCLNVLAELDMIDRPLPPPRTEHAVEDNRDNSGHIQVNYPAPFAGFFEPRVRLMEAVNPGDVIGTVVDHPGGRREEVLSTQAGLILCLRVFNRVHQGDSLAAVLEPNIPP